MLHFYNIPIVLDTDIENDNLDVYYFSSSLMPEHEIKDHYFHNNMQKQTSPLIPSQFLNNHFILALTVPEMRSFVDTWFKACEGKYSTPVPINKWFYHYIVSRINILLARYVVDEDSLTYYEQMTLQNIQTTLNGNKTVPTQVLNIGKSPVPVEYTLKIADYIYHKAHGTKSQYSQEIESIAEKNALERRTTEAIYKSVFKSGQSPRDMLPLNEYMNRGNRIDPVEALHYFVRSSGIKHGSVPNYVYILACLQWFQENSK